MSGPNGARGRGRVAVLSGSWRQHGEQASAVKSIAGALSRSFAVDVWVRSSPARADGAFETFSLDAAPAGLAGRSVTSVIVDLGDMEASDLAREHFPGAYVVGVGAESGGSTSAGSFAGREPTAVLDVGLPARGEEASPEAWHLHHVGLYARVHPYAAEQPHLSLGAIDDYLLVLGAGTGATAALQHAEGWTAPSAPVAWIAARFPRRHVVAIEGAVAQIWRSRSCVGSFGVHTRMDLWRLLAHAQATVDLAPGTVYARECVESLRYGTPVVACAGSPADALVAAGGGLGYTSTSELLDCVAALADPGVRADASAAGREAVEPWYGDPGALVSRATAALERIIGAS